MQKIIENIKRHEGFRGEVYRDTLGFNTIGYGTKLPLSKKEASVLLEMRLKEKIKELEEKEPFINSLPLDKQSILVEMSYQLGVNGVLKFKKMWVALKNSDYKIAALEMLDSRWHIQTPRRAKELSDKMMESINKLDNLFKNH